MNAFVHLSLPDEVLVDIEEHKLVCNSCNAVYLGKPVQNSEHGVHIDSFVPEDGHCHTCGSSDIVPGGDPIKFEKNLEHYKK